jgi:replicative superfamily II helicase
VHLKEALNAEIALGNIATLKEAFDWVNYTFYAIRLRRNPIAYGCKIRDYNKELAIEMHITETIENALEHLDKLRLIRFDRKNNYLSSTELGRITSHYYINCDTMSTFCKGFGINMDALDDYEDV